MSEHLIDYPVVVERFKTLLKANALKFTKQRELVLKCLYDHKGHFTPEEIQTLIQKQNPTLNVGIATIYRTLALLEEENLASSLSFGTQGKRYEFGMHQHHDHLICTQCGTIIEFFDEALEARQDAIAKEHQFQMQDHTMKIYGICNTCQSQQR